MLRLNLAKLPFSTVATNRACPRQKTTASYHLHLSILLTISLDTGRHLQVGVVLYLLIYGLE